MSLVHGVASPLFALDTIGSALVGVGVVGNSTVLMSHLVQGENPASVDAQIFEQGLIILALVLGFVFQQIGRLQTRHDDNERSRADRAVTARNADLLAEVTRLRTEKIAKQVEANHVQVIASIEGVRESADKAISVVNHANEAIEQTKDTVAEAIRAAAAMDPHAKERV